MLRELILFCYLSNIAPSSDTMREAAARDQGLHYVASQDMLTFRPPVPCTTTSSSRDDGPGDDIGNGGSGNGIVGDSADDSSGDSGSGSERRSGGRCHDHSSFSRSSGRDRVSTRGRESDHTIDDSEGIRYRRARTHVHDREDVDGGDDR